MIALNDPKWQGLKGGYGTPYDASIALKKLEETCNSQEVNKILAELWDELHHQGDIDLASCFAVPHLIRIAREKNRISSDVLGLITVIEVQRQKKNLIIPKEYEEPYLNSLKEIPELIERAKNRNWDLSFTAAALSALAASKGQLKLAEAILNFDDENVLEEFLGNY